MKLDDLYPSRWLKAADVARPILATIKGVTIEEVAEAEEKPVMQFHEPTLKPLVLNRTNGQTVALLYGDDIELWKGKPIVLFATKVPFQGKLVDAIRCRGPRQKTPPAPAPVPVAEPEEPDDVGF